MVIHTDEDAEILRRYFHDIEDSRPLSREREVELAERITRGDMEARDELVQANLRFVVDVARQYQNRGLTMAELVSAGNMGLMKAADRFDGERGFKFISYAVWWIRQNMMRDISRATHHLGGDQRDVTVAEIAERLGVAEAEVLETMLKAKPEASLDRTFEEGDDRNLLSTIPDESNGLPDDSVSEQDSRAQIQGVLATLDDRERYIVRCYYGLDGEEPLTLEQVGGSMGLTRERVRQLKERALSRLRDPERYQFLEQIAD